MRTALPSREKLAPYRLRERRRHCVADLAECVEKAKSMESGQLATALGAGLPAMDAADIPDEAVEQMLGMAGVQNGLLPERMAEINEVLNILPPTLRERLLVEFVNDLFRHRE